MTFSLRSSLIVMSILACWLGALVSKSPMLMELAATVTALLIFLTLAFAIWDVRPDQRAFWTGFFVLAFGNLILTQYFTAYQYTGTEVATRILGQPNFVNPNGLIPSAPGFGSPSISYYQPSSTFAPTLVPSNPPYAIQLPATPSDYYQQLYAIRTAVPNLLSLVVGLIGGWLTLWISRQTKKASDDIPVGTPV